MWSVAVSFDVFHATFPPALIKVTAGEHPALSSEGPNFRRFRSKVSGPNLPKAEPYIGAICKIAKQGSRPRVKLWHELNENDGLRTSRDWYDRNMVNAAEQSFQYGFYPVEQPEMLHRPWMRRHPVREDGKAASGAVRRGRKW